MPLTVAAIALVAVAEPPARKEPPTQKELTAITDRRRDLGGYDAAAWHASDALQAKQPKEGSVVRYIARKIDKRWVVAFGRLDEKGEKFLIAYEATQGAKPDVFDVQEMAPLKEEKAFFLSAAKAIDTSPSVPEMVITKQFVFQVDPDGSVRFVGKAEDVLKRK